MNNYKQPAADRAPLGRLNGRPAFVRAEALRGSFPKVVKALGGNAEKLMAAEGISADLLEQPSGVLVLRSMISLLERAALELDCPDFGLRLAGQCPDGVSVLGPLEVAMRNSATMREALNYCAKYLHVYSPAVHIVVERDERTGRDYMLWDLLLDGISHQCQVSDHALGLGFNAAKALSNGQTSPVEIWLTHEPKGTLSSYREFFGVPVKFGMPYNALYFAHGDLDRPITTRDPQVYEMAVTYIDLKYPLSTVLLATQVRVIMARLLVTNRCTQTVVAEMLAMHPRTFQRRLREEGTTFEAIVDVVRREIALRNLVDSSVSLVQIAEKLGYSETSVLTRSCHRWFSCSPRQIRKAPASVALA